MRAWLWDGGAFVSIEAVPLSDRGFRYGMSLFESIAVQGGVVEFWPEHQRRLVTGCVERDFTLHEAALDQVEPLLSQAGMDGFARVYVTAGDGGPATPIEHPRIFVMLEPRAPETEDCWSLGFHDEPWTPVFAGLKTANYWRHCEALSAARLRGFDEALLFNDHAELVSVCCANVFVVHEERIRTPGRASGCRLGVAREWVTKRRKVEEVRLRREDVLTADEVFITNSWLGVMPIATVEGRPLGPRRIGPRLMAEWRQRRESGHDSPAAER